MIENLVCDIIYGMIYHVSKKEEKEFLSYIGKDNPWTIFFYGDYSRLCHLLNKKISESVEVKAFPEILFNNCVRGL